jgi:hypothetical protein
MAKKKQIGILGAAAIAMASVLGGAQHVNAVGPSTQQTSPNNNTQKKDAVINEVKTTTETNRKGLHGGVQNPYKYIKTPKKNQRQIRKWKRQNPNAWR